MALFQPYWHVWLEDEPIGGNIGIEGRLSVVILSSSLLREGARLGFSASRITTKEAQEIQEIREIQEIKYLDQPLHLLRPPTQ